MPKIVEVKFPTSFEDGHKALPMPLGRLVIGIHVCRIMFSPEGRMILYAPKIAVDDGSIILYPSPEPDGLYGFGMAPITEAGK